MKRTSVALLALAVFTGTATAVPVSDEQKSEFYQVCMGIAQNNELCTCKADVAPELIDADFMSVVISAMRGKTPPDEYAVPYDDYIRASNAVCIPGY